jgi:hypothetical protein
MQYICDAGAKTWFRIETPGEAMLESQAMNHAVERYFKQSFDEAAARHAPDKGLRVVEQSIGRKAHIEKTMPIFATLRDGEGNALVTAMLPPQGKDEKSFRPIIVGPSNANPYPAHGEAIKALAAHYKLTLDADRCFPYRRT